MPGRMTFDQARRAAKRSADGHAGLPANAGKATLVPDTHAQTAKRSDGNGLYAPPGDLWKGKRGASAAEKRVETLIDILLRHTRQVTTELDAGIGKIDPALIAHKKHVLELERGALLEAATNLPTGSALMMEAFDAAERAGVVITQLKNTSQAHETRATSAIATEASGADKAEAFESAADGRGYCDLAPQERAPCELDPATRHQYRQRVIEAVARIQAAWTEAIRNVELKSKLATKEITFEQQLGQILFGLLFDVVGVAAKALVKKGLEVADKAFGETHQVWGTDLAIGGVAPATKATVEETGNAIVDKGTPLIQAKLTQTLTAQQLAAKAAHESSVPRDEVAFLAAMQQIPLTWRGSINVSVHKLFDADLAGLVVPLERKADALTIAVFQKQIESTLDRFKRQVMSVNAMPLFETRPVQVIMRNGAIRWGLVKAERARNEELRGEWKQVEVLTTKYTFLQWLDDDMKDMAVTKAIHRDVTAGAFIRAANDARFWDERSLRLLAGEHDQGRTTGR
jgi:hypothetical protein